MFTKLKDFKNKHPFGSLLLVAFIIRLIAIFCVGGYGSTASPDQSITALMTNFMRRWFVDVINCEQCEMFVSRAFYSMISLFIVSLVYRIIDLISNDKNIAWTIALVPSLCCIMPTFGTISNVDVFLSIILLLYGSLVILRQEGLRKANFSDNLHRTSFAIAGFFLGIGIFLWTESVFFIISLIIILFARKNNKGAIMTTLGCLVSMALLGLANYLITGNFNFFI